MDAVVAHSEAAMRKGSSSFSAAAGLFGRELREDVWQLYAWCRHCDDQIDGQDHGGVSVPLTAEERQRRLDDLRRATRDALTGHPVEDPAFRAFQRVALKHGIAPRWPLELLDGLARDVEGHGCRTQDDILTYSWGVAGTVGVMMSIIMGAEDLAVLRRAQDLGLAFQLTNICRDVREDALNGRVYLPEIALLAAGVEPTPAALLDPANRDAVHEVVLQQLELAEAYYRSARVGLRRLPFRGALAVGVAREAYRAIGRRIRRAGPRALDGRMSVPKPLLLVLALRGAAVAVWSRLERRRPAPPRPALWSRI